MENLAKALVAFQSEAPTIGFDSNNPHFGNEFVSLAGLISAIRPTLTKHGLAVVQFPTNGDGYAGCVTHVIHESGERMEHEFLVPLSKKDPQGACAAVTYARRYSLSGALGLCAEKDDDGNTASTPPPAPATMTPPRQPNPRSGGPSEAQVKRYRAKVLDAVNGDRDLANQADSEIKKAIGVASIGTCSRDQYEQACKLADGYPESISGGFDEGMFPDDLPPE